MTNLLVRRLKLNTDDLYFKSAQKDYVRTAQIHNHIWETFVLTLAMVVEPEPVRHA